MVAVAVDLGASSGIAVAGQLIDDLLRVRDIHRWPNQPVRVAGRLHWDILRLYHELLLGIGLAGEAGLGQVTTVGIDAWGLDFGFLDRNGELLGNPYHYRDEMWQQAMAPALDLVPQPEIFARTGIQFMAINSLYQLFALQQSHSPLLEQASTLLMVPDLLRSFLTGEQTNEYTISSTTQMMNLASGQWDLTLIDRLGLPGHLLAPIVPPASRSGPLLPAVRRELNAPLAEMVAVAEHDTASAALAVPATGPFAFLSCGTWSLLGTETTTPVITDRALAWNVSNEGGIAGTYRVLKNIMGLWLVEGCRRSWARDGSWSGYDEMLAAASVSPPFTSLIDPDDASFLNPEDMPAAITAFCLETGQQPPDTPAATLRCVLDSLALQYRLVLERLEIVTCQHFDGLHVVGGGVQNHTLMQFTANAIARPVWAGPAEATVIGNLLGQLLAMNEVGSVAQCRAIVQASFPVTTYVPRNTTAWNDAYGRYLDVLERNERVRSSSH